MYELMNFIITIAIQLIIALLVILPPLIFIPLSIISLIFVIKKWKNFKVRTLFISLLVISVTFLISYAPLWLISSYALFYIIYISLIRIFI